MANEMTINKKTLAEIEKMDSATFAGFTSAINLENDKPAKPMTRAEFQVYADTVLSSANTNLVNIEYKSRQEYDSVLKAGKGHSWLERTFVYKLLDINNKYKGRKLDALSDFKDLLMHSLPQLLFISLPLLALLFKLLYIRRKEFYYVNHGIFSLHLYIFIFIALLVIFSLNELNSGLHWWIIGAVNFLLYLSLFFYEYKAMRNFYKQRRAKTILKFILLNLMFLVVLSLLFTVFVFFSFFKL